MIIRVDDFFYDGTEKFVEDLQNMVSKDLKISKDEKNKMRFCRVDYQQTEDGIIASGSFS